VIHAFDKRARRRAVGPTMALLVAMPLIAVGCGSDDDKADSTTVASTAAPATTAGTGATTTTAASGGSTTTAGTQDLDAAAVAYVGGKAQAATGSTIKIGMVNATSGSFQTADVVDSANKTIDYINTKLNGINGHKVQLVYCDLKNEEAGTSCGTQMVNDKDVKVVVMGLVPTGTGAFYKVIDNKTNIIQTVPISAEDFNPYAGNNKPNVFNYGAGVAGQQRAIAKYLATVVQPKPKEVSLIVLRNPGAQGVAGVLDADLKAKGVATKTILLDVGAGSAAIASALQAGKVETSDYVSPVVDGTTCVEVYKYLKANNLNPIGIQTGGCNSPAFTPVVGNILPEGWISTDPGSSVLVPSGQPIELLAQRELKDIMAKAVLPQYDAAMMLGLLNAVKGYNKAPEGATVDQLSAVYRDLPGPIVENPAPVTCGSIPNFPTVCGSGSGLITVKNGQLTRIAPTAQVPVIDYLK
jgi:branched-chain amino acid transport system substrate-binding protein